MTQYRFGYEGLVIWYGWDRQLQTLFCTALDEEAEKEEDYCVWTIGPLEGQTITDMDTFKELLAQATGDPVLPLGRRELERLQGDLEAGLREGGREA